jgi:hypothetical protein
MDITPVKLGIVLFSTGGSPIEERASLVEGFPTSFDRDQPSTRDHEISQVRYSV